MINNLRWIGALGAVYVAYAAVGTAQASPDDSAGARGPGAITAAAAVTGNRAPWLDALDERSTALNREYGLGDHAERQLGAPGANWLAALNARSVEMNRAYALGDYRRPLVADDRSGLRGSDRLALSVVSVPSATAKDGFAWDDAALSAAATLGIAALLGAGAVSIRYRRGVTPR